MRPERFLMRKNSSMVLPRGCDGCDDLLRVGQASIFFLMQRYHGHDDPAVAELPRAYYTIRACDVVVPSHFETAEKHPISALPIRNYGMRGIPTTRM